ncbi:MAG: TetR/AcrR family transcriptional regulator [Pseudomonadota bacterium]
MGKKIQIIEAATRLFATQGFDATTTKEIVHTAGATEPLLFYHFKGKEALFTEILDDVFDRLNKRFDALPQRTDTPFEKIENLMGVMLDFVTECPNETKLVLASCPARLKENAEACRRRYVEFRGKLEDYIGKCLKAGIRSKDFRKVSVPQTVNILIALINGLLRQQTGGLSSDQDIRAAAVAFCRAALIS